MRGIFWAPFAENKFGDSMKKRTKIRIIAYACALVITLTGFYVRLNQKSNSYQRRLTNLYLSSLDSLCDSLGNINIGLKKTAYVTTPEKLSLVAAEIYHESGRAMSALSQLEADGDLSKVYKFVSQAGDYSLAVSRNLISEGEIKEEERENLKALQQAAEKLAHGIDEMRINVWSGEETKLSPQTTVSVDEVTEISETMSDYPTLIYDGPYSDHILTGESEMLASSREITLEEAREKAAKTLSVSIDALEYSGEQEGKLPAYRFITDDTVIAVSKRGGYTLYFRKYRQMSESLLSYEQALTRAKEWLSAHSNLSFKESYFFADEGVCTVNFAYKEGGTVCYTDLIKVGVALDNGEIVLCEADGFIMNHTARTIKTPAFSLEEAQKIVSPSLTVNAASRVLIPSDGEKEKACYEFVCADSEGQEVLVYINSENLREERIFLVLKTDGGTLTK